MSDLTDAAEKLPFKKNATPAQMITLVVFCATIFVGGWWASAAVKEYFDSWRREMASIVSDQSAKIEANSAIARRAAEDVEVLRRAGWTNAEMNRWSQQLERLNRTTVPAFVVPDVPPPSLR